MLNSKLITLPKSHYAAAVSGGSDSLSLLFLAIEQFGAENITALHFNHKLRPESDDEAEWLKALCSKLGVNLIVGEWAHNGTVEGNLQQEARLARYAFFKQQHYELNFEAVLVGHTQDDVVETMLMRLGRGSGLEGLSAMNESTTVLGVPVMRPLLNASRESLKNYLEEKAQAYISDPSNENDKFFRIRVRKLKPQLEEVGLVYDAIHASASSLSRANDALSFYVNLALDDVFVDDETGCYFTDDLFLHPQEIQIRVLGAILNQLTGEGLAPRTSKRIAALEQFKNGKKSYTLGGVKFTRKNDVYCLELEQK